MNQSETDLRKELEERLRFETLLTDLSTRFVSVPVDQVDGAIEDAQRRIVETLGLGRSSVWQFSEQHTVLLLTHSWVRPGLQPFPLRMVAQEYFPWLTEGILGGEIVRFGSLDELPPEAVRDLESLRKFGPKSNVTLPGSHRCSGISRGRMESSDPGGCGPQTTQLVLDRDSELAIQAVVLFPGVAPYPGRDWRQRRGPVVTISAGG